MFHGAKRFRQLVMTSTPLWVGLLFLLAGLVGCGRSDLDQGLPLDSGMMVMTTDSTSGSCGPSTCPTGCCDSNGNCQAGTSTAACGTGGLACSSCASNSTCSAQTQTCTTVTTTCNASTCPSGCCDGNGNCQAGTQITQCGTAGATCANCQTEGFSQCDPTSQACDTPMQTCSAASCPTGCCEANGAGGFLCVDGTENATCGTNGASCQNCSSVGAVCDGNAGVCVAAPCGPSNCGGCCLGAMCITGNAQNACGVGGSQCQNCGSGTCSNGACSVTACSSANCGGCCDATGQCQGGGSSGSCGTGGAACTACPPGAFCNNGSCTTTTSCGPQNCPGCCDGNGNCQAGSSTLACGVGGEECFACGPGSICSGGGCEVNNNCGPENCPGCCDFNGVCQPGTQTFDCGVGGETCSFCPANSTCQQGFCFTAPVCGPQNCDGCCDPNGICQAGSTNSLCGQGGESCAACPAGFTCTGDVCEMAVTNCGPSNCATGCCQGNECLTGESVGGCGTGGGACTSCPAGDTCTGGKCVVPPCGPTNCSGCCGITSGSTVPVCLGGGAPTACGFGGNACTACPNGDTCQGGVCQGIPDAGACGPDNCGGCCLDNVCQIGISANGCGFGGGQCTVCPAGDVCPQGFCQQPVDSGTCGPENCSGCCDGNHCVAGTTTTSCGLGGEACTPCAPGLNCNSGFCSPGDGSACSALNCAGCCDSTGACQPGDTNTACGNGGEQCLVCAGNATCSGGGILPPGFDGGVGFGFGGICKFNNECSSANCAGCCDATGVCHAGTAQGQCGATGSSCEVCPSGTTCTSGTCVASTKCGPSNCTGCCDQQGICEAGFIDTACGQSGGSCEDCTSQDPPTTCDSDVSPRTCSNQQTTCPSPFPSCPAGTTTPVSTQQDVCPATDLANLDEACNAGQSSTPCTSFFQFEKTSNPSCYACLTPFNIDFNISPQGIFECLAPFVGSTCNGETGCADLCSQESCSMCPSAGVSACEQTVLGGILNDNPTGQCSVYLSNLTCVFNALQGEGSFCQPFAGYGDWLQAVGQFYCGQ